MMSTSKDASDLTPLSPRTPPHKPVPHFQLIYHSILSTAQFISCTVYPHCVIAFHFRKKNMLSTSKDASDLTPLSPRTPPHKQRSVPHFQLIYHSILRFQSSTIYILYSLSFTMSLHFISGRKTYHQH